MERNFVNILIRFDATQVSIRLLMFHVYFFTHVARPEGISLVNVAENYDAFYGRPSTQMKEALQVKCKQILQTKAWPYVGSLSCTYLYVVNFSVVLACRFHLQRTLRSG